LNIRTARIIHGVPGPSGEPGILLLVPPSEALDWDLEDEVASTSRYWMANHQAWWIAAPYASTAAVIVARVHGPYLVSEGLDQPRRAGWWGDRERAGRAVWRLLRGVAQRARQVMQRLRKRPGAGAL
jgi:hypothetical protein